MFHYLKFSQGTFVPRTTMLLALVTPPLFCTRLGSVTGGRRAEEYLTPRALGKTPVFHGLEKKTRPGLNPCLPWPWDKKPALD